MTGFPEPRAGMFYNARVRRCFRSPDHAGDASGPAVTRARGATRFVLSAETGAGRLRKVRFRADGCPHAIALAEEACRLLEGRETGCLARFAGEQAGEKLEIPVEKTGLILLLEDTVAALDHEISARSPNGTD